MSKQIDRLLNYISFHLFETARKQPHQALDKLIERIKKNDERWEQIKRSSERH